MAAPEEPEQGQRQDSASHATRQREQLGLHHHAVESHSARMVQLLPTQPSDCVVRVGRMDTDATPLHFTPAARQTWTRPWDRSHVVAQCLFRGARTVLAVYGPSFRYPILAQGELLTGEP